MTMDHLLATRTNRMGSSAIREILKIVSQPGMVSLAGGIPAPESFPMEIIKDLTEMVIERYASKAFQYDLTEGFIPLRQALVKYLADLGIQTTSDDVMITSGSQGALDAIGKIFISKGEKIAVEAPTYLGALQAFNPYEPEYIRIEMDDHGCVPESLEMILKNHAVKFVYLVPTFQNPTGRTITLERRKRIAKIAQKYNALIIEDDPYSLLRYSGKPVDTIQSLAPEHVVYLGTFSKILSPGLRIGFVVAPKMILNWLILAKQGVDLHTSTFNQALAAEYLFGGHLKTHLPKIIDLYKPRMRAMLEAMDSFFPEEFKWVEPEGGMFIWAEGPKGLDMETVYWEAVKQKTAFVPGKFFYTSKDEGNETMRLNYTMADEATIRSAIETLGKAIKKFL